MRSFKKLGVLVAVFALCAIGAANASAAEFTASATGSLTGVNEEPQVFTAGSKVTCDTAHTTGTISSTAATQQHVTVSYDACDVANIASVHISDATYLFTSNGNVHVESPITITVTKTFLTSECTITVPKQTVSSVDFTTNGNHVTVDPTVTGIDYTSTGGPCGSSGTNGTYEGASTVERVNGGWLAFDS